MNHFVGSLGLGSGFSLGRGVIGSGSSAKTPSGVDFRGTVVRIWLMRSCTPSRAAVERQVSREEV